MEEIVSIFLQFQITLKIYHWRTNSYSRHKASDSLIGSLNSHIDKFVEVMQGSRDKKISFSKKGRVDIINVNDKDIITVLKEFKAWFEALPLPEKDLQNIREELLADVNQTLYLFTLH